MPAHCSDNVADETRIEAMSFIRSYWKKLGGRILLGPPPKHGHKMKNDANPEPVIFAELKGGPREKEKRHGQRFGKEGGKDFCVLRCKDKVRLTTAFGTAKTKIIDDGKSGLHITINWGNWRESIKTILDWAWIRSED
jgi:hypothetical protein